MDDAKEAKETESGEAKRAPEIAVATAAAPSPQPVAAPKPHEGQGKRRLGMLPEVLPAPSNQPIQGSPRQRTLRTMERLLAAAAASALIANCSSENGSGGGGNSASASGGGSNSSTGNGIGGYGVVDPLPPPARCMGVATSIQAKGAWKTGAGGSGLVLSIELSKPGQVDASYLESKPPEVIGGTLVSSSITAGAMALEIQPSGQSYVQVSVSVTCAAGDGYVVIYPTPPNATEPPPKEGDAVALYLEDM